MNNIISRSLSKKGEVIKLTQKVFVLTLIFLLSIIIVPSYEGSNTAHAASQTELNNLQTRIDKLNAQINTKRAESASLANEIAIFDAQIKSINLQIQANQKEIDITKDEIAKTNKKIAETRKKLKEQQKILNEYLRVIYENNRASIIEIIISSDSFSDFINRNEYRNTMHDKVRDLTVKVRNIKDDLDSKKESLNEKKGSLVVLKKKQNDQKKQVKSQRYSKLVLLTKTKGEEGKFQKLVGNVQAEFNKIQNEIWASTGSYKSQGSVNRGDIIGYMGNSGYSTGAHLHFEVRSGGDINPTSLISSGRMSHPLPSSYVSQGYGAVGNVAGYSRHTGIDYVASYGAPVRAADGGTIIARVSGMGNTYPGQVSYGNYVMIKHNNGLISMYAHLK